MYYVKCLMNITAGPGEQVEGVGGQAVQHGKVSEVVSSVDEEDDVDDDEEEEEGEEGAVVPPVVGGQVVGQLLVQPRAERLPGRGLGGNQPFTSNKII